MEQINNREQEILKCKEYLDATDYKVTKAAERSDIYTVSQDISDKRENCRMRIRELESELIVLNAEREVMLASEEQLIDKEDVL